MSIPKKNDWFLLGSIDVAEADKIYTIGVGYSIYAPGLYVRVWIANEFIGGSWVSSMENANATLNSLLSKSLIEKCIIYAKRVEKMKVFI